jgi:hypothetical protein
MVIPWGRFQKSGENSINDCKSSIKLLTAHSPGTVISKKERKPT